jgi:hypothetical protein
MWVMPRNLSNIEQEQKVYLITKRDAWGLAIHNDGCDDGDCEYDFRGLWKSGGEADGVEENEWYHVAIVSAQYNPDDTISNIYLNGLDAGDAGGLPPADNNNPIWIGANQIADGNLEGHFDGLIDEIRIHDIALRPCAFLVGPGLAYPVCPVPLDDEQEVDPCGVVLSWTPGESADSREVYFSTDFAKVDALDVSARIYGPGTDTNVPLADLENNTRYYWRVVEDGDGGPWEGEIWSFITD